MISPIDLNNWSFSFTQKVLLNASQHKTSRSYQSELNKNFKSSKYKPLIKTVFSKVDSCWFDVFQCSPVRHVDHFIFSSLSVSSLAAIFVTLPVCVVSSVLSVVTCFCWMYLFVQFPRWVCGVQLHVCLYFYNSSTVVWDAGLWRCSNRIHRTIVSCCLTKVWIKPFEVCGCSLVL